MSSAAKQQSMCCTFILIFHSSVNLDFLSFDKVVFGCGFRSNHSNTQIKTEKLRNRAPFKTGPIYMKDMYIFTG
jgi:hypothetical protein